MNIDRQVLECMYRADTGLDPSDAWLVMTGDCGGQVYLTVPWKLVGPEPELDRLLIRLDVAAWGAGNDNDMFAHYLLMPDNSDHVVDGGMGGGELTKSLWLHEEFRGDFEWTKLACELLGI
jgi:hypothetical protein